MTVGVFGVTLSEESTVGDASFNNFPVDFGEPSFVTDASVSSDNPFIFSTTLVKFEILSDDDDSLPVCYEQKIWSN